MPGSSSSSSPPEIGVGASDTVLLAVSGVGFCLMALTMFFYIIPKLKNANELLDDEDELDENGKPISYDEKLARITDVSNLNRAQRRARARHIMKQQRKEDGNVVAQHQREDENNDEPPVQDIPPMNENNNSNHQNHNLRHLSRKERTERAKQKEREERRALESVRQREQQKVEEELHRQKMEKDRQKAIEAEQQRRHRIKQRETDELIAYKNWRTFLPIIRGAAHEGGKLGTTNKRDDGDDDNNVLTVHEWIKELNEPDSDDDGTSRTKIVTISSLSRRCGVPPEQVRSRIHELLVSGRVAGILEEEEKDDSTAAAAGENGVANDSSVKGAYEEDFHDGYFIYVPWKELSLLASQIEKQEEKITLKDMQRICHDHLFTSSDQKNLKESAKQC